MMVKMKLKANDHSLLTNSILECFKRKLIFNVADLLAADFNDVCRREHINARTFYKLQEHYLNETPSRYTDGLLEFERVMHESFIISTNSDALDEATEGGFYSGEVTLLTGQHSSMEVLCSMIDCNVPQAIICTGGQFEKLIEDDSLNQDRSSLKIINISDFFECFEAIEELKANLSETKSVKIVLLSCMKELLKPLTNIKLRCDLSSKTGQLGRAVRRLSEINVCCLLCACDDDSTGGRSIIEGLARHADNVFRLKEVNGKHAATIIKSNKRSVGNTIHF